jgi:hypothetical protein
MKGNYLERGMDAQQRQPQTGPGDVVPGPKQLLQKKEPKLTTISKPYLTAFTLRNLPQACLVLVNTCDPPTNPCVYFLYNLVTSLLICPFIAFHFLDTHKMPITYHIQT